MTSTYKEIFKKVNHLLWGPTAYIIVLSYLEASMHRFTDAQLENLWPITTFSILLYLYYFVFLLPVFVVSAVLYLRYRERVGTFLSARFRKKKDNLSRFKRLLSGTLEFIKKRLVMSSVFIVFACYLFISEKANVSPDGVARLTMFSAALVYFILSRPIVFGVVTSVIWAVFLVSGFMHYSYYWTSTGTADGKSPNILLIVSDTTRRDHMSFYGYERDTTRNMKKLADSGTVFNDAHSTSSWTKPATASLVTSKHLTSDPVHHGAPSIGYQGTHMAEFFRARGYDTAMISANSNASSFYGTAKGYKYRVHSLAPEHSALQKFTIIRFYQRYFEAKTSLNLKNQQQALGDYLTFLGITPEEVDGFLKGTVEPKVDISEKEKERYRKFIEKYINNKAAADLLKMPYINKKQDTQLFGYLKAAYTFTMEFFYLNLENADGNIVDYWIQDHQAIDLTTGWLQDKREKDRPFFIHLQMMGPHTPYVTQLPDLLPHFDPDYGSPTLSPSTQHTPPSIPAPAMPARKLQNMIASYDDSLRNTDANLQRLIEHLEKSGEINNTLIVFIADHGESFYEHNIYGHMNSLHSELVDIPMFFYWKNKLPTRRVDTMVSIVDVFPSLVMLSGYGDYLRDLSLVGYPLFTFDKTLNPDIPVGRSLPMATLVGSAWKMKRTTPMPFGIHTAVVNQYGKIIREMEEVGTRLLYFPPKDRVEQRIVLQPDTISFSPMLQELLQFLPTGPVFN
ncbi:MAG: sulfatase-like hydrolase/transferase [Leptospirales bacterium]